MTTEAVTSTETPRAQRRRRLLAVMARHGMTKLEVCASMPTTGPTLAKMLDPTEADALDEFSEKKLDAFLVRAESVSRKHDLRLAGG